MERDSSPKYFLEVNKGIEHLQQNALGKLHFLDPDSKPSLVIKSFLLKLKTITTCFEQYIFHNNLKDNVYGQIYY